VTLGPDHDLAEGGDGLRVVLELGDPKEKKGPTL
jgi:hypothetical protein